MSTQRRYNPYPRPKAPPSAPISAEKKARITLWLAQAITETAAAARNLVPLIRDTSLRNWEDREALFDFAQRSPEASPVLVKLGRPSSTQYCLYTKRRPQIKTAHLRR